MSIDNNIKQTKEKLKNIELIATLEGIVILLFAGMISVKAMKDFMELFSEHATTGMTLAVTFSLLINISIIGYIFFKWILGNKIDALPLKNRVIVKRFLGRFGDIETETTNAVNQIIKTLNTQDLEQYSPQKLREIAKLRDGDITFSLNNIELILALFRIHELTQELNEKEKLINNIIEN